MRQVRLIGALFALGQFALAHSQTFNRRYDLLGLQLAAVGWDIERTNDGGYVCFAASQYTDSIMLWFTLSATKIDDQGQLISEFIYPEYYYSTYPGFVNGVAPTKAGDFVVGGARFGPNDVNYAKLSLLSADLDTVWTKIFGDSVNDWIGRCATQSKDGGYLIGGETSSIGHLDGFLIKTDSSGNELWRRTYGWPSHWDFIVTSDTVQNDTGYFIGGASQLTSTNFQLWVMRINEEGDTLWSRRWGSQYDEPDAHLTTLANGDPIVGSAWGYAPDLGLARAYMAELDQNDGHLVWEHWYGPIVNTTTLWAPKEVRPGAGCITAGFAYEANSNFFKGLLLRTAANGDSLWMRTYFYYDSLMTDGLGVFKDVIPTCDGGFIACGLTHGSYTGPYPPTYSQDTWIVKVDSMGCLVPGCDDIPLITAQVTNLSGSLTLYPNPVPSGQPLQVRIDLPSSFHPNGPLVLSITGPDGKFIKQQLVSSSSDLEQISLAGLHPGTYALHLSDAHTWIAGKKFVVY